MVITFVNFVYVSRCWDIIESTDHFWLIIKTPILASILVSVDEIFLATSIYRGSKPTGQRVGTTVLFHLGNEWPDACTSGCSDCTMSKQVAELRYATGFGNVLVFSSWS